MYTAKNQKLASSSVRVRVGEFDAGGLFTHGKAYAARPHAMFQIRDSDMDLSDDTKHSGVSSFAYTLRSIGPFKVPVAFDTDLALADKPAVARMGFEPIRRHLPCLFFQRLMLLISCSEQRHVLNS